MTIYQIDIFLVEVRTLYGVPLIYFQCEVIKIKNHVNSQFNKMYICLQF
jgi:hypothetical protein